MKLTKCDIHPDRDAIVTYRIIKMPTVGMRPIFIGYSAGGYMVDLCEECVNEISILNNILKKDEVQTNG